MAWRAIAIAATAVVTIVAGAVASEQSERLVARAQVAWSAGRNAEAEDLFAAAVAADDRDVEAHYGLAVALIATARWPEAEAALHRVLALRPGDPAAARALALVRDASAEPARGAAASGTPAPRWWSVRGHAGVGYDGNVPLLSHGTRGQREDAVFGLGVGATALPIVRDEVRLQFDYDFDQTLHPVLQEFDLRSNRLSGTLHVALVRGLWASLSGGVDHYSLGSHQYLVDPFVQPFLSYDWAEVGTTQLYYRHGQPEYLSAPFEDARSGQTNGTGVTQLFYLGDPARRLTVGYGFEDEDPRRRAGDDYQRASHGAYVTLELPVGWQTTLDLGYGYRHDGYREINQVGEQLTGTRVRRVDELHTWAVGFSRPLTEVLSVRLDYQGTANTSNIFLFDYRRPVVFMALEARY